MTYRRISASAPAISTPEAPPPTITTLSLDTRSASVAAVTASSKLRRTRLRMFSASVMFDMASASRLTASIPKKFGTQPVARIR